MSVDPGAEDPSNTAWSPYCAMWSNPVNVIDPTGAFNEDGYHRDMSADSDPPEWWQRFKELANTALNELGINFKMGFFQGASNQSEANETSRKQSAFRDFGGKLERAVDAQVAVVPPAILLTDASPGVKAATLIGGAAPVGGLVSRTGVARSLGVAGEKAVGIVGRKIRIPSLTGTAQYRVPDRLTATTLTEVKNVSRLSYTRQLRDFNLFAQDRQLRFELFTRANTRLSGPLADQVRSGKIILRQIPQN